MYFHDGLSFRNTAKALSFFLQIVKISHLVSIWNPIQKYKPWKLKKKNIEEYFVYKKMKLR